MTSFDWWVLGVVLLGNGIIWIAAIFLLYRRLDERQDVSAVVLEKRCDLSRDEYTVVFQVNDNRLTLHASPELYADIRPDSSGTLTYAGESMVAFRTVNP